MTVVHTLYMHLQYNESMNGLTKPHRRIMATTTTTKKTFVYHYVQKKMFQEHGEKKADPLVE